MAWNHSRDSNHPVGATSWLIYDKWRWPINQHGSLVPSAIEVLREVEIVPICGLPASGLLSFTFILLACTYPFVISQTLSTSLGEALSWPSLSVDFDMNLFAEAHPHRCEAILSQTSAPCHWAPWLIHSDSLLTLPSLLSCYFTTAEPLRLPRPNSESADSFFFLTFCSVFFLWRFPLQRSSLAQLWFSRIGTIYPSWYDQFKTRPECSSTGISSLSPT